MANLPGSVLQTRVGEAFNQFLGVAGKVSGFWHFQGDSRFMVHVVTGHFHELFILHTGINGFITGKIAKVSQNRVAAIKHTQLHLFVWLHIGYEHGAVYLVSTQDAPLVK